jgi:hypothetical protein
MKYLRHVNALELLYYLNCSQLPQGRTLGCNLLETHAVAGWSFQPLTNTVQGPNYRQKTASHFFGK